MRSGAGDGNRTRVISLEGWGSTIELRPHMVGTTGFEPAASCSQSTRATRLRHVPTSKASIIEVSLHLGNARFALPQGTHAVHMSRSDVYCECNQPRDRLPRG